MITPINGNIELLKFTLGEIKAGGELGFVEQQADNLRFQYELVGENNQEFLVSLWDVIANAKVYIERLEKERVLKQAEQLEFAALQLDAMIQDLHDKAIEVYEDGYHQKAYGVEDSAKFLRESARNIRSTLTPLESGDIKRPESLMPSDRDWETSIALSCKS